MPRYIFNYKIHYLLERFIPVTIETHLINFPAIDMLLWWLCFMESHESTSLNALVCSRMLTVPLVCIVLFCLFVPGVAFTQSSSAPDSLTLTAGPGEILRGGDMSVIIARVTSSGVPCNGCPVTFTVDKSDIAFLPIKNTNVTGSNGETILFLTSTDMSGIVTVTAEAKASGSTNAITATITLTVVDWGTIGGTVSTSHPHLCLTPVSL